MANTIETTFTFRNIESTEALRAHTLDKMSKLSKYLIRPATAHIIFNLDGTNHVTEITVNVKGGRYFGVGKSNDMYTSIDGAVDNIKKQVSRSKERVKCHKGE